MSDTPASPPVARHRSRRPVAAAAAPVRARPRRGRRLSSPACSPPWSCWPSRSSRCPTGRRRRARCGAAGGVAPRRRRPSTCRPCAPIARRRRQRRRRCRQARAHGPPRRSRQARARAVGHRRTSARPSAPDPADRRAARKADARRGRPPASPPNRRHARAAAPLRQPLASRAHRHREGHGQRCDSRSRRCARPCRRSTRRWPARRTRRRSASRPRRWRRRRTRSDGAGEQKALAAARGSAVIGVAARLSAALEAGLPFATDLGLLTPLAQGDAKLGEIIAALQPIAATGVASRASARRRLSRRRQGRPGRRSRRQFLRRAAARQDCKGPGLAAPRRRRRAGRFGRSQARARRGRDRRRRPRQGRRAGEVAAAADSEATAGWLARAEAHLAAKRAVDQLAAHAVTLLGAAR